MIQFGILPALAILLLAAGMVAADEPKKDAPNRPIGRMVYWSGRVQGVGFRATAVDIARDRPVTGWVKNLADGRVQLLVEGSEEEVKKFLEAIRKYWKDDIEKEEVEETKPTGKYRGFTIMR